MNERRSLAVPPGSGMTETGLENPWQFVREDDRKRIAAWAGDAFYLNRRATDPRPPDRHVD